MDFYNVFLNAHKGLGYLVLVLITLFTIALLVTMFGYSGKVSKLLRKSTLFTMILFHIQFLVGICLLLIYSPGFKAAVDSGTLMNNAYNRQTFVEHPFSMLIAAVLMTIINKKVKSNDTISLGIVIMGLIAVGLFTFAFPWAKVFGA